MYVGADAAIDAMRPTLNQSANIDIFNSMRNETEDAALSSLPGARTSCAGDRRSNKKRHGYGRAILTPPPRMPMRAGKDHCRLHTLSPSVRTRTTMVSL